jgi:hypothetical protein
MQPESFKTLEELEALGRAVSERVPLTEVAQSVYDQKRKRSGDKRERDREGSKLSMFAKRKIDAWLNRLGLELCKDHRNERLFRTGGYGKSGLRSNRRKPDAGRPSAYEVALENTAAPQSGSLSPESVADTFVDYMEKHYDRETIDKIVEELQRCLRRRGYITVSP